MSEVSNHSSPVHGTMEGVRYLHSAYITKQHSQYEKPWVRARCCSWARHSRAPGHGDCCLLIRSGNQVPGRLYSVVRSATALQDDLGQVAEDRSTLLPLHSSGRDSSNSKPHSPAPADSTKPRNVVEKLLPCPPTSPSTPMVTLETSVYTVL